jgi:hypothetical protein
MFFGPVKSWEGTEEPAQHQFILLDPLFLGIAVAVAQKRTPLTNS